jgi:hypothetical protein
MEIIMKKFLNLLNIITKWIVEFFPGLIEFITAKTDNFFGSTQTFKFFNNRSLLSFLLPLPVFLFMLSGPSQWPWHLRGGLISILFITGIFIIQLIYFLFSKKRWRGMAWIHFGLLITLSASIWFLSAPEAVQASDKLYRHYYLLLAPLVMFVAIPVAFILKNFIRVLSPSPVVMNQFYNAFNAKQMAAQPQPRKYNLLDVIRSYFMVILRKSFHVIAPVAIYIMAAEPEHLKIKAVAALLVSIMLFTTSTYDPGKNTLVSIFQRICLSGGSLFVTLIIILMALLRLLDMSYVTTVLDAGSKGTIFSYIISTYFLFWFYDFWVNQAILDLVIKGNRFSELKKTVHRHGGGRIAVVAKNDDGKDIKRIYEPSAFLMDISFKAKSNSEELIIESKRAQQRFRIFSSLCLILLGVILYFSGMYIKTYNQLPGLRAKSIKEAEFNLADHLLSVPDRPVIMLAASGGGTRAALYTTSVLHGLDRIHMLDRLVLGSGVSGGSAALAYFAIYRPELISNNDDTEWQRMYATLSSPFIDDVLAGAAEIRITLNTRLGQLLTDSFARRFPDKSNTREGSERITLREIDDMGLIFNTAYCGSEKTHNVPGYGIPISRNVGRLSITNIETYFDRKKADNPCTWELDLPYYIVRDPDVSLFAAASLSANFPPVFSNAAVEINDEKYWVTDGGAVENRGIISILLALKETLGNILANSKYTEDRASIADIHIIVADAGAFDPYYSSDRGLGAKSDAAEKIANRLISELIDKIREMHKTISGRENGIMVTYLPMPDSLRASGTFGTHWMMPDKVIVKNLFSDKNGVDLNSDELIALIDAIFCDDSFEYINRIWPDIDPDKVMGYTDKKWKNLKGCLGVK